MKLRALLLKQVWIHHGKWKNGIDCPYLKVCVKIHLLKLSLLLKYSKCMLAAKPCLYASYPVLLIYTSSAFITLM